MKLFYFFHNRHYFPKLAQKFAEDITTDIHVIGQ